MHNLLAPFLATWIAATAVSPSAEQARQPAGLELSLRLFLRDYTRAQGQPPDKDSRVVVARTRLNSESDFQLIVLLQGRSWCGSGGCTALVVTRGPGGYRVITKITIVNPPIRVLASTSKGWHDIAVLVRGGGNRPGYEALLTFDGVTYPENPSVPPARPAPAGEPGEVVITGGEQGQLLYAGAAPSRAPP